MEEQKLQRIHDRIDETNKLLTAINLDRTTQTTELKKGLESMSKVMVDHISKMDAYVFHPKEGHIVCATKKFSAIFTQIKIQWVLLFLLLSGIVWTAFRVVGKLLTG